MAFFDWLRRVIEPNQAPKRRPRHAQARRRPAPAPVVPETPEPRATTLPLAPTPVSPTPQAAPQPVAKAAQVAATLVVRLVDDQDQPLQPALVLTGALNQPVNFRFPKIPGYALRDVHGFTQDYISAYGLTTLVYVRHWGQPIISYLVDYDTGRLLELPGILRGRLGTAFSLTPPAVENYHIFQAQGQQRGTFSQHPGQVVYYYRRDSWQMVQRVHQFVFLQADHQVFDGPNGQAYGYQFPTDSLWRLFMIITLTNGDVWYNLGGEQWLSAKETVRREHQFIDLGLPEPDRWHPEPFERIGTVDYVPGKAVSIYHEPYGETAGQLDHGEALDIRGRVVDDQQLVWYQIGPDAYINARYVRLALVAYA
ncbi:MucBP domain-containing protein [Levilactobacillus mulengensis]|uniref:MucBP domain-containing protein n=1 Tax=Levilactobacillus mulengensis TaxID=2486025 RepID=UPI000F76E4B2|nr:MucBP domain-containing protein [Levilactobacillus mulengensis]